MAHTHDLVGSGWTFPIVIDRSRGGIRLSRGADEIEESIRLILMTPIGQRFMRPTFGCRIHELVFAPLNAGTFTAARHYIADALAMWEPRIDVTEIEVEPAMFRDAGNCLFIRIHYRIRATHDERSLVWPFYMIPTEP